MNIGGGTRTIDSAPYTGADRLPHVDFKDCRDLWCAVVIQMIRDLSLDHDSMDPNKRQPRREAEAWFGSFGQDFIATCLLAGINPNALRAAYEDGRLHTLERV